MLVSNSIKVAAMVERVVKKQADLGVDIVTDGEVELHLAKVFQNANFPFFPGGKRGVLHALSETRCAGD